MTGKGSKVQVRYSVVEGDRTDAGLNKTFDMIFSKAVQRTAVMDTRSQKSSGKRKPSAGVSRTQGSRT